MKKLLISLLCFFSFFADAQELSESFSYARHIVDTLASPSMHGRGYVNGGDSLAAFFIRGEFKKANLSSFGNSFYQRFSFPVNTFPGRVSVSADGKALQPGKDFIVYNSPTAAGKYRVVVADEKTASSISSFSKFLKKDLSKKVLIVNDTGKADSLLKLLPDWDHNAPQCLLRMEDKLTWTVSSQVSACPVISVLRKSVDNPKEISFDIENRMIDYHLTQNIAGYIAGSAFPDSFIVFSAHYDHLGQMGTDTYFPGANDNASGCAMLLSLVKYYSAPEHRPSCSIAFIAFAGEEAGLLGSRFYTEHPLFPLKQIRFLVNMDIMGTGEDGITVVNGSVYKKQFEMLQEINAKNNYLTAVKIRGKAANSDHYLFSEKGVPAIFIYTMGGIKAYHDIYDRPETLPLNKFDDLLKLITSFTSGLQSENN